MTTRDQAIRLASDILLDEVGEVDRTEALAADIVDALIDAGLIPDREPRGPRSSDEPA